MAKAVVAYDKDLPEVPGRLPWEAPTQHIVKDDGAATGWRVEDGRRETRLLLVPKIRQAVNLWRKQGYPGASDVTKRLFLTPRRRLKTFETGRSLGRAALSNSSLFRDVGPSWSTRGAFRNGTRGTTTRTRPRRTGARSPAACARGRPSCSRRSAGRGSSARTTWRACWPNRNRRTWRYSDRRTPFLHRRIRRTGEAHDVRWHNNGISSIIRAAEYGGPSRVGGSGIAATSAASSGTGRRRSPCSAGSSPRRSSSTSAGRATGAA